MKKIMRQNKIFLLTALTMLIACQLAFISVRRASSLEMRAPVSISSETKKSIELISADARLKLLATCDKAQFVHLPTIQQKFMSHPSGIGPSYLISYPALAYKKQPTVYFKLNSSHPSISTSFLRVAKHANNGNWYIIPSVFHEKAKTISLSLNGPGEYALVEWLRLENNGQQKNGICHFRIVQYAAVQHAGFPDEYIPNANLFMDPQVNLTGHKLTQAKLLDSRYISSWKALGESRLDTLGSTAWLKTAARHRHSRFGVQLTLNSAGKSGRLLVVKKYLPEN